MKYLIKYELRLGDIVRMFPACRHLASQGHEVSFHTFPEYKTIFDLISYAQWVESANGDRYHRFLDPQIWPGRYLPYRQSHLRWKEFVYGLYPDIAPAVDYPIVFDRPVSSEQLGQYRLPDEYVLISPFGHSQYSRPTMEWLLDRVKEVMGHTRNVFMLSEVPVVGSRIPSVTAASLSHLAPLIANAKEFFTINSAPSIIASAVRRQYYHVYLPDFDGLDDFSAPNQIVLRHV